MSTQRRNAMTGDHYSIPLESGFCTICRSPVEWSDKLVAVLGNNSMVPTITDLVFINEIPKFRQDSYVTVPYNENRVSLFQHGRDFPQTFLFHNDCYKLLDRHASRPTVKQIWMAGDWTEPVPQSRYQSPFSQHLPFKMPRDMLSFFSESDPFRNTLERIAALPVELQWMIIEYSIDSLLWRFATALTFPSTFGSLWNGKPTSQPTSSLDGWIRGQDRFHRPAPANPGAYVRFGLDGLGIRTVELISSLSSRQNDDSAGCVWYIIEPRDLGDCVVEGSGGFLRLCTKQRFLLWDTPVRPELSQIRWNVDDASVPFLLNHLSRLRNINRLDLLTGLTVFCWGGSVFAIHQHMREGSSAFDTYQKISWRHREYLTWFYIPLRGRETIAHLWTWPEEVGTFALSTTSGKAYTFGCYRVWAEHIEPQPLNTGPLKSIIFEQPQFNKITYFGVHSAENEDLRPTPRFPAAAIDYKFSPELNCSCYVSEASLERVAHATVFCLDRNFEDWGRGESDEYCHGILFQYRDGTQAVLGECRFGCARTYTVRNPTRLCFKLVTFALDNPPSKIAKRMSVRFASDSNPDPEVPGSGSQTSSKIPMKGMLRWWCGEGDGYFSILS